MTHARRMRATVTAAVALALLLGTLATAIVVAQEQAREHLLATFRMRGTSSATFVSTFLVQQAARERQTAEQFLSAGRVSVRQFQTVVAAFGSNAAVLLNSSGRLLDVAPSDPALLGDEIATHYAHLTEAEHGEVAVSNVVPSAVRGAPIAAVAVPFPTNEGRRVFSAAYPTSGSTLEAFVAHTISYREHDVFLVDHTGRLLAASPATEATTLAQADPALARASAQAGYGPVGGAQPDSTFTSAPVAGTPWRLLIEVPDSRLYASIGGFSAIVPWIVFVLVSVLGVLLVGLFARSLNDRVRLERLSTELERTAQTDSLTGLFNRRALTEHLTRAAAHARRRGEPLSVLMIDLDRFKQINDRYGHEAGDQVLCAVADCMREVLRADDVYGRWGGDEFLVAMPHTDERGAGIVTERLRAAAAAVELADIGLPEGVPLSVGGATAVLTSPAEIVRAADMALYRAKSARRSVALSAR